MREVGAAVADVAALEREEAAVGVGRQRELAHDLLRVPAGRQRLVAILDPLDRRAHAARELGDDRLLHEELHLEPEAAADGRADDAHARVLEPELRREHAAHEERHLRRRPDRDRSLGGVPVGDHAATLERRGVAAAEVEALAEDVRRCGERAVDVARLELDVREVVVAELLVQDRRSRRQCRLCVEHCRQRVVLDVDQLGRVLGHGARGGDDGGDRLADEAHAVERQHVPGARLRLGPRGDGGRERREVAQTSPLTTSATPARPAPARSRPRRCARGRRGCGRRRRAAYPRLDVVEVDAPAGEEARILHAHHARADVAAGHRAPAASAPPCARPRRCQRSRCSGRRCRRGGRGSRRRSGPASSSSRALAASSIPGVQNPHCSPWQARNASWMGCSPSASASPSTVSTSAPSACTASIRHESVARPSTSTVQAPQAPCSQPTCVPVSPSPCRRKSESSVRGSAARRGRGRSPAGGRRARQPRATPAASRARSVATRAASLR